MSCAYCGKAISNTQGYIQLRCNVHLAHSSHEKLSCPVVGCGVSHEEAAAAKIATSVSPSTGGEDPEVVRRKAAAATRIREPLVPFRPGKVGQFIGGVMRTVSKISSASVPDHDSNDPFTLLKARVPLADVVNKRGFDITELINDYGVTINDFFGNGYAMSEMCDAFSSRMNSTEGMDVLYHLGISAEHFRLLPQYVQVDVLRKKLGYEARMLPQLGYTFTAGAWTLPQMLSVGLTMPLVTQCGLQFRNDWEQLKAGATPEQLHQFGWCKPLEDALIDGVIPSIPSYPQQQQQQSMESNMTTGGLVAIPATEAYPTSSSVFGSSTGASSRSDFTMVHGIPANALPRQQPSQVQYSGGGAVTYQQQQASPSLAQSSSLSSQKTYGGPKLLPRRPYMIPPQ